MNPPAFQFRGPSIMLNAKRLLIDTNHLSNTELGRMMDRLFRALKAGKFEEIKSYSFVDKVFKGTTKRPHIPLDVRRRVLSAGKCAICLSTERLTVDHIIPFSKGGAHDESNFQCLCFLCNIRKSNR